MSTHSFSYLLPSQGCTLHKFGGSSLRDASGYLRAVEILRTQAPLGALVVLSASGNTTNELIEWYRSRSSQQGKAILYTQCALLEQLFNGNQLLKLKQQLLLDYEILKRHLLNLDTQEIYADFVGQGEIWSARILSALLTNSWASSRLLDARLFLKTEAAILPTVDTKASQTLLRRYLETQPYHHRAANYVVIPGFVASNKSGKTILLGRNGSDYSATQIAALTHVQSITLWGDTIGVYSADPYRVKGAIHIPRLSFNIASELARLGNHLFHSRTLDPIREHPIPLFIRSSLFPEVGGTEVLPSSGEAACEDQRTPILTTSSSVNRLTIPKRLLPLGHKISRTLAYLQSVGILPLAYTETETTLTLIYPTEYALDILKQLNAYKLQATVFGNSAGLLSIIGPDTEKAECRATALFQLSELHPVELIPVGCQHTRLTLLIDRLPTHAVLHALHERLKQIYCSDASSAIVKSSQYLSFDDHRAEKLPYTREADERQVSCIATLLPESKCE